MHITSHTKTRCIAYVVVKYDNVHTVNCKMTHCALNTMVRHEVNKVNGCLKYSNYIYQYFVEKLDINILQKTYLQITVLIKAITEVMF